MILFLISLVATSLNLDEPEEFGQQQKNYEHIVM